MAWIVEELLGCCCGEYLPGGGFEKCGKPLFARIIDDEDKGCNSVEVCAECLKELQEQDNANS